MIINSFSQHRDHYYGRIHYYAVLNVDGGLHPIYAILKLEYKFCENVTVWYFSMWRPERHTIYKIHIIYVVNGYGSYLLCYIFARNSAR